MSDRIIVCIAAIIVIRMLYKWTWSKKDESAYDDYSATKPPLYVYYNTAAHDMPMNLYFILAAAIAVMTAVIFHRFTNNVIASVMVVFIVLQMAKQRIIIRSIRNSQAIDYSAPGYFTFFGSILKLNDNPIFALGQSAKHASPRYRKILETLKTRLENGKDPYLEIEWAKKQFRNQIFRNFLDDVHSHITKGNVLHTTLDGLIERADDRKSYASERRIETYASVLVIYGGIAFEALIVVLIALFRPSLLSVFVETSLGQFAVWIMVAITGMMLTVARRLILLSEG